MEPDSIEPRPRRWRISSASVVIVYMCVSRYIFSSETGQKKQW